MTSSHAWNKICARSGALSGQPAIHDKDSTDGFMNRLGLSLVRGEGDSYLLLSLHGIDGSMVMSRARIGRYGSVNSEPKYLFHGLYGSGTRGTIRGLPLGPGEGCVEIVQA